MKYRDVVYIRVILMQTKNFVFFLLATVIISNVYGQAGYTEIPLPANISSVNEEFSGITIWKNRLYLLPQYGSNKGTKLDGDFFIYSIRCDTINKVIDGKDSMLTAYHTIRVRNLEKLPDTIKKYYEGFEAINIVNGKVFFAIETDDAFDSCYLVKGKLDTNKNEIIIDPVNYAAVKRYPYIINAGFESMTWVPKENKLLAVYEYNGMHTGGIGYLIDTSLRKPFRKINLPFLDFRITDIAATNDGRIYGINYFWSGDYNDYLNNNIQRHEEENIKKSVSDLKENVNKDPGYLKKSSTCYSRIVMLNNYKDTKWKQVAAFECAKNNWEGISLFRKGVLVISDANRNNRLVTTLAYVAF